MEAAEILKKIRTLEIKTRGLVETAFAGDYRSVFKGRGMNFEDVREYQPGDEIRSIDWNVTARMGNAFVKKFTEERELTVILVVDVSASGNFGSTTQSKRELAAEVACLLAFSAIRNNDKVGLILFTDRVELFIPPKKGRSHTLRLIREILFFEPQGRGTEPALALDYLNNIVTRRAVVFFISDFQAPRTPFGYSINDDVDAGGRRISRYCATGGLFDATAMGDLCRDVSRTNNRWLDHLVDCETTKATATASIAAGPRTRSARTDAG